MRKFRRGLWEMESQETSPTEATNAKNLREYLEEKVFQYGHVDLRNS
jgi:hypothetical protein